MATIKTEHPEPACCSALGVFYSSWEAEKQGKFSFYFVDLFTYTQCHPLRGGFLLGSHVNKIAVVVDPECSLFAHLLSARFNGFSIPRTHAVCQLIFYASP